LKIPVGKLTGNKVAAQKPTWGVWTTTQGLWEKSTRDPPRKTIKFGPGQRKGKTHGIQPPRQLFRGKTEKNAPTQGFRTQVTGCTRELFFFLWCAKDKRGFSAPPERQKKGNDLQKKRFHKTLWKAIKWVPGTGKKGCFGGG